MKLSIEEKLKRRKAKFDRKTRSIEKNIEMCIAKKLVDKKDYYEGYLQGLKEGKKILEFEE